MEEKQETIKFPTLMLSICQSKERDDHFALRFRPETPKLTDSQTIMSIHFNPWWFSWKYRILLLPAESRIENEWIMLGETMKIKFKAGTQNPEFVFANHLVRAFKERKRELFSNKHVVCRQIHTFIRNHEQNCKCDDIVSVVEASELNEETCYWLGKTNDLDQSSQEEKFNF